MKIFKNKFYCLNTQFASLFLIKVIKNITKQIKVYILNKYNNLYSITTNNYQFALIFPFNFQNLDLDTQGGIFIIELTFFMAILVILVLMIFINLMVYILSIYLTPKYESIIFAKYPFLRKWAAKRAAKRALVKYLKYYAAISQGKNLNFSLSISGILFMTFLTSALIIIYAYTSISLYFKKINWK